MATVTPASIAPAAEMAGGINPKCSATGRGAFGRNGGRPALWRSLLILALLLLPAFLLSACADIRIGGFSFGSCLVNGEEFTHVSNVILEIRTDSFPRQVLETHTKEELKVHRAPRSLGNVRGKWGVGERGVYFCVVKKSDWPEAMPAKLSSPSRDEVTAITPRGQTVSLVQYDIDHWVLLGRPWPHPIWE